MLVGRVGIEPTTTRLKVGCSTTELPAQESYSSCRARQRRRLGSRWDPVQIGLAGTCEAVNGSAGHAPDMRPRITRAAKTAADIRVVHRALARRRGATGAPGSVPGTRSPASCCEWIPNGNTANRAVNQIVMKIAIAIGVENGTLPRSLAREVVITQREQRRRVPTPPLVPRRHGPASVARLGLDRAPWPGAPPRRPAISRRTRSRARRDSPRYRFPSNGGRRR